MSNLIEVDNVHYSINENNLIRGISFELKKNEICHIQGVNGSGKTSLLKIILGIVEPTKGVVHRKENLNIQFHGHKLPFKGFLTLLQNLKLILSEDELIDAQKVLEELDLHEKLNLRFSNLSFGQQKKSFFASKLVIKNTQVFILDEPFVGLDDSTTKFFQEKLQKRVNDGAAIIITSHIPISMPAKTINI